MSQAERVRLRRVGLEQMIPSDWIDRLEKYLNDSGLASAWNRATYACDEESLILYLFGSSLPKPRESRRTAVEQRKASVRLERDAQEVAHWLQQMPPELSVQFASLPEHLTQFARILHLPLRHRDNECSTFWSVIWALLIQPKAIRKRSADLPTANDCINIIQAAISATQGDSSRETKLTPESVEQFSKRRKLRSLRDNNLRVMGQK